jgi:hypothetical protein
MAENGQEGWAGGWQQNEGQPQQALLLHYQNGVWRQDTSLSGAGVVDDLAVGFTLVWAGPGIRTFTATSNRPVLEGEPTLFEIWVCADGYWADHTKNLVVGELTDPYRELEAGLREVYDDAVAFCVPGASLAELDRRIREGIDRIGYPRKKVHVVVNRHSKHIDVELQKVELHLGEHLIGFVPNDYKKVMDSINLGQPLVQGDSSSRIAVEIRRLAAHLSGGSQGLPAQPRKGFLKSIFNRQESPTTALELRTTPDGV